MNALLFAGAWPSRTQYTLFPSGGWSGIVISGHNLPIIRKVASFSIPHQRVRPFRQGSSPHVVIVEILVSLTACHGTESGVVAVDRAFSSVEAQNSG